MAIIKKYNPLTILVRALDATDRWLSRMDYQGRHHQAVTG